MDKNMNEIANTNLKRILNSFDDFVTILENPIWAKSADTEEIKSAFKLGHFIEKTMAHFRSRNATPEFINMLNTWWNTKNRTKNYCENVFEFACDHLLVKFFKCENIAETALDITVRVYTSIFPRERLQKVLTSVILLSSSYEAITDFAGVVMTSDEANDLEYRIKLTNWSSLLQIGRKSDISAEVANSLSLYRVESTLCLLIGILSLSDVSEPQILVQNIILENILQKMLDRSVLSNNFWLTLFKRVETRYICNACINFKDFLISLFNFIVYVGSMMIKDGDLWQNDANVSLHPEINYHDLLAFIRNIYNITALKEYVLTRLNEAKEYTDSCIWDKIKEELS